MRMMILAILLFFSTLTAQSLSDEEQKMMSLEKKEQLQNMKIDSLRKNYETALDKIDQKKSAKEADSKEIASMMAGAFDISKKIEKEEAVLKSIHDNLQTVKLTIYKICTQKIDSLQNKTGKKSNDSEKKKIEQEILRLAEKRMLALPVLTDLKFDPRKIRDIDLKSASEGIEESIFKDYLAKALAEIDSHLTAIRQRRGDLDEMKRLEAKAEIFLADAQDSRIFEFYPQSQDDLSTRPAETSDYQYDYNKSGQIDAFRTMILQLYEVGPEIGINSQNKNILSEDKSLSRDQYLELIKTTQKYLELYRKLILKKMENR
ncbi:MAG: hypothetical protein AB7W47_16000 [Calditrichaceae bacterium]